MSFARLVQVFDLKNSKEKWQWLRSIQEKAVPLSKNALFNHCASDVAFLKMICEFTTEAVDVSICLFFQIFSVFFLI